MPAPYTRGGSRWNRLSFEDGVKLSDLIDLEAQLSRDRDADPGALEARDRGLVAEPRPDPARPHAAIARWLAALRAAQPGSLFPGHALVRSLRVVRAALAIVGLALGWGAAAALLRFEGPHPVNVWDYLLAFVGVQLVLLALLVVAFAAPIGSLGVPLLGALRAALAAVVARLARAGLGRAREEEWRALAQRLRTRRSLYRRVEPWLLFGLTQLFAVGFNAGVLLATLRAVVFSDVPFAWGTTLLQLGPERFHGIVRALATPWAGIWPGAVPSEVLVEATRYSRLEAAYFVAGPGRAADPALVGAWWPFLLAAVVAYGLVPRAAALALARGRAAWLLATLPLDDVEVRAVLRRVCAPRVETRGAGDGAAPRDGPLPPAPPRARRHDGGRAALVLWRDVPRGGGLEEAIGRQLGAAVGTVLAAGGRDHAEVDWARFADGLDPVVVLAEAWEAPDGATLRLLRRIREALGPGREVVVLLGEVGPDGGVARADARDVGVWRDALAPLGDPWLAVEAVGEGA
jgi:hypothetical protein